MSDIEKEILTEKEVRKLHRGSALFNSIIYIIPMILGILVAAIFIIPGLYQGILIGLLYLCCIIIPAFVRWIKAVKYLARCPKEPVMVISKRIEAPKASPFPLHDKYSENKFLYFEHYGWFPSPDMDCPDERRAYQNATENWWDSELEDEFYLLLDSDYNVVHVYPCKKYEYTGKITKHTVVNGKLQRKKEP